MKETLETIKRLADKQGFSGLVFIPTLVKELHRYMGTEDAHILIRQLRKDGKITIQFESGVNLLTEEEKELCLICPHRNLPLSWISLVDYSQY